MTEQSDSKWLKLFPAFLTTRVAGRHNLQKMLGNTSWLLFDKVLRMGVGLFVGVWIARYLGPDQFGLWNYALAFSALFGTFATLGLDGIVVRELVKNPQQRDTLLGSAFVLKLVGGIGALLVTIVAISLVRSGDSLTMWLVGISAAGFIFQSLNVIDLYFQAQVKSRYTVLAANCAFVIITIVKITLLLKSAPLIAFAWAGLVEIALTSVFLLVAYRSSRNFVAGWQYDRYVASALLKDSWPLVFSGLAVAIFMKIDQIMLKELLNSRSVGIYSAAVRLSEVWYFIGSIVISSTAPSIYAAKSIDNDLYLQKLLNIFKIMVVLSVVIISTLTFLSSFIVHALYGPQYSEASKVLIVHTWSTLFVFIGSAHSVFWIAENLQRFSLFLTVFAAFLNIALNFLLIPQYGATGAAIATLISYGIPTVLLPYFLKEARPLFFMFFKSLNFFKY